MNIFKSFSVQCSLKGNADDGLQYFLLIDGPFESLGMKTQNFVVENFLVGQTGLLTSIWSSQILLGNGDF
jgi:hypothetical protein